MRTLVALLVLTCVSVIPCLAETDPPVTAQVNTVGDFKDYVYTLTNDTDSAVAIGRFTLFMPESAARSVVSFTCSSENWYSDFSFRGDNSIWAMGAGLGYTVAPGDQIVFTLRTPASVPTSYTFRAGGFNYNWQWNTTFASSLLPVPVPEPSSILALAGGLAGVGGFALRRRR